MKRSSMPFQVVCPRCNEELRDGVLEFTLGFEEGGYGRDDLFFVEENCAPEKCSEGCVLDDLERDEAYQEAERYARTYSGPETEDPRW